jgi:surface protein
MSKIGKGNKGNIGIEINLDKDFEETKIQVEQGVIVDFALFKKFSDYENCVCKLIVDDMSPHFGTGFFCYIPSREIRVLITNNHVVNEDFLRKSKELKMYLEFNEKQEEKIINLQSNRFTFTNEKLDVTVIEILDEDLIHNFLEVDENLIKDNEFKNEMVLNLQFPGGGKLKASFGKIIKRAKNENRFVYDAGTDDGSSGSPIILTNGFKIIGIHKAKLKEDKNNDKTNIGIYLDKVIPFIPKSRLVNNNIIKCLYDIKKEDVNRVIQVYDNKNKISKFIKSFSIYRQDEKKPKIDNGKCKFEKEGKYFIFYELENSVNDLSDMFNSCTSLTKVYMPSFSNNKVINLSNIFNECTSLKEINFLPSFNTKNVINMSNMFSSCYSLENINLSSFNTENVRNMSGIFKECKSLKTIDLSSFNTEKVEDMSSMFEGCRQLQEINLSTFNTEKAIDMSFMFKGCQQLREINLSSFNTKCVKFLQNMFDNCNIIEKLDLSSFNISNVTTMKEMFKYCQSLKEINLSNSKSSKNTFMKDMFLGCSLLEKIDNCNDKEILKEYELKDIKIN